MYIYIDNFIFIYIYVYIYTHKLLLAKVPQAREYLGCPGVLSDVPCKALSPPLISRFPESHNKKNLQDQLRSFTAGTA